MRSTVPDKIPRKAEPIEVAVNTFSVSLLIDAVAIDVAARTRLKKL